MGVLVFFALTDFSLSILAIISIVSWAKDLDGRIKKLEEKQNETAN